MSIESLNTEKKNKGKQQQKSQSIQDLWDSYKRGNIYAMGTAEKKEVSTKGMIMAKISSDWFQTPNHRSRKFKEYETG